MQNVVFPPRSLRNWFLVHFWVDYALAVPLFLFPAQVLSLLNWGSVDLAATRLVAAALLAIGGVSLVSRNSGAETYKSLLALKIIWSLAAIAGIVLTALTHGIPGAAWAVLATFKFFASIWSYYYLLYARSRGHY